MARRAVALTCGLFLCGLSGSPLIAGEPARRGTTIGELVARVQPVPVQDESERDAVHRNAQRLAQLGKPLRTIRVEATIADEASPPSSAAALLESQEAVVISSSGVALCLPRRYSTPSCHRPLYFEQLNLERCGRTEGCATNLISGVHFLTNTVMLPYRLATERPDCPVPSHGDCRTCQSYSHDIEPFGIEPRGILVEAAAMAGFVFLAM